MHRAGALFREALEAEPDDLSQWMAEARGEDTELQREVKEQLGSDKKARGFVAEPVKAGLLQLAGAESKEKLGEGGIGAVYLARPDDAEYKLVKPGVDAATVLDRFRRERQTPEGVRYMVMEFIEGKWITDYCRRMQLSTEAQLRLILPVCAAINDAGEMYRPPGHHARQYSCA
jgi:serine/threonine-protein kinase